MTTLNVPIQIRRNLAAQMPAAMLAGELFFQTDTNKLYCGTGTGVVEVGGAGGGGVWGTITGTLSDQLDLQSAFDDSADAISDEATRAEAAEGVLSLEITNEAHTRSNNDSTIVLSITAEVTRAEAAEGVLTTAVSTEVTRAEAAEGVLTTAVSTETTRAETAEALLVPKTTTVAGHALSANVTLAEGDITNLTTDLAAKAPLASPGLTGTPTAPTAAAATNTTQIATTAFVESEIPLRAPVTTVAGKTGAVTLVEGDIANLTTDLAAKAPLASPALTGTPTAPTQSALDNSTKLSTTAYSDAAVAVEKARALAAEALSELLSHKDAASGYAGLDSNGFLKPSEYPAAGSSAGDGAYMWTMDGDDTDIGGTSTVIAPTGSNNVLVFKFVCRKTITIRKVVFMNGTTVTASATASFGIYDSSGNLLLDSGTFSTATASQTLSNTLASSVTLHENTTYYFAQACTNGTNTAAATGPSTLGNSTCPVMRNKNVVRQGVAANAYSAGALPPTLGVVTGFTNRVPVAVLFES